MRTEIESIVSNNSVTLMKIENGRVLTPITVPNGHQNYLRVRQAVMEGKLELAYQLANIKEKIQKSLSNSGFVVTNGVVKLDNFILNDVVSSKLLRLIKEGVSDLSPIRNYVNRILENPSRASAHELYDFLGYRELPITPEGMVLAWKGVRQDDYSVVGNTKTVVLQGKVDSTGHIYNGVGEIVEVKRICVDDDRTNECSYGLHVGSLDYARGHGSKLKLVMFDPKDAVSVPKDCSFQKLRVCKYEVLADVEDDFDIVEAIVDVRVTINFVKQNAPNENVDKGSLKKTVKALRDLKYDPSDETDRNTIVGALVARHNVSIEEATKVLNEVVKKKAKKVEKKKPQSTKLADRIYEYLKRKGNGRTVEQIRSALKTNGLTSWAIYDEVQKDGRLDSDAVESSYSTCIVWIS